MARIQKSRTGTRVKRAPIHAKEIKDALRSAIDDMGIKAPRFGEIRPRPKPGRSS